MMVWSAVARAVMGFGLQPIVMSSPHPPADCLQRVVAITSRCGNRWYLDYRNIGLPDPRFRGAVGPSGFSVARFSGTLGTNSFVPWVTVRVRAGDGGGAVLTGTVGLAREVRVVMLIIAGIGGVMLLTGMATAISLLTSHHPSDSLPFVLVPLALVSLSALVLSRGLRSLTRNTPKVVDDVMDVLSATVPARAAGESRS